MARNSEGPNYWRRFIFFSILSITISIWLFNHQAGQVADRAVSLAFPNWEVYYGSIWLRPTGGAWIRDVDMVPLNGDDGEAYHFDKIAVEIPFAQFYRSAWNSDFLNTMRQIKDVTLRMEGGSGEMSWPFTRALSVFGNASASPFEAEGCAEDGAWTADEFPGMGLIAGSTKLTMAWHRVADRIVKEQSIETEGVGRVDYRGELVSRDDEPLLNLTGGSNDEVASSEWHVVDSGFVAARNKFCASKDGITPAEFTERHLASVQRVLAAAGLEARESTLSSYRRFAEHGGKLDISVSYFPTINASVYKDDDWTRWLARMRGNLSVHERTGVLGLRSIAAQPFPEEDEFKSVWSIVSKEREQKDAAKAAMASAETAPPATAKAIDHPAPTIAVVMSPVAGEELLYAEEALDEERPRIVDDYAKLSAEVGQRFMLYTKGKPAMRVEIVGMDEGVIKVRRYLRSGWLEQGITRAAFERAERVH